MPKVTVNKKKSAKTVAPKKKTWSYKNKISISDQTVITMIVGAGPKHCTRITIALLKKIKADNPKAKLDYIYKQVGGGSCPAMKGGKPDLSKVPMRHLMTEVSQRMNRLRKKTTAKLKK